MASWYDVCMKTKPSKNPAIEAVTNQHTALANAWRDQLGGCYHTDLTKHDVPAIQRATAMPGQGTCPAFAWIVNRHGTHMVWCDPRIAGDARNAVEYLRAAAADFADPQSLHFWNGRNLECWRTVDELCERYRETHEALTSERAAVSL